MLFIELSDCSWMLRQEINSVVVICIVHAAVVMRQLLTMKLSLHLFKWHGVAESALYWRLSRLYWPLNRWHEFFIVFHIDWYSSWICILYRARY